MALSLEDRQQIADLVSRYNMTNDAVQAEEWAATFTEDGTMVVNGMEMATGRAALIAHLAKRNAPGAPKLRLRHWTTNLVIEGDGAKATLAAYVMAFRIEDGLGPPYVMGEYKDDLVKSNGNWKFKIRRMTVVAGTSTASR